MRKAMEAKLSSKKRKQVPASSSNPFKGIFTRSKSQIYIHQTRSGKARHDKVRSSSKEFSYLGSNEAVVVDVETVAHTGIKDLRARRVFSPTCPLIDHESDYKCQIQNDESPNLCDSVSLTDNTVKLVVDLDENVPFMEDLCNGNMKSGVDLKLGEDCVQLTPPDDEIGGNGGKNGKDCFQLTPPPDDESGENGGKIGAKTEFDCLNVSVSKSKRAKLFKTPSSFSYRRLLPYLMDITKDGSCMQKIEMVDLQFPCKVQKLDHMNPNFSPMPYSKPSENDEIKSGNNVEHSSNFETRVEINHDDSHQTLTDHESDYICQIQNDESPNLCDSVSLTDNTVKLVVDLNENVPFMEDLCNGNMKNGVDLKLGEDCVQLTPADDEFGGNGGKNGDDCFQLTPLPDDETGGNGGKIGAETEFDCLNVSFSRSKRAKLFKIPSSFNYRRLLPYLMDISKDDSCMQKIEIVDLQFPCKVQKLDHTNPNFLPMPDSKPLENDEIKAGNNVEHSRNFEDRVEINYDDSHQTTPPDTNIFSKLDDLDVTEHKNDNSLQNDDIMPDDSLNVVVSDQTKGLISNHKPNENKLPYKSLNAAISDQTKILIANNKQNGNMMPNESLNGAVSDQTNCLISNDKPVLNPCSRKEVFKIPGSVSHRRLLPSLMEVANDNPGLSTICQEPKHVMNIDQNPIISKDQGDIIRTEESKLPTDLTKDSSDVLQISINCGEVSPRSVANPENISSEIGLDVLNASIEDQIQTIHNVNALVKESSSPNPSPSAEFDTSETKITDMRKGILRKNPRGCRGICNCLNCASFRLHADKAFEFSKNQMQDIEEIASELVNDLGYMRNLLKETTDKPHVVKSNQVNEACNKSLKTEELVKNRLIEMNEDLKFHCRNTCVQRSSVTFSANNTEKLIPKITSK